MRRCFSFLWMAGLLLAVRSAGAGDKAPDGDLAAARTLAEQAQDYMDHGQYANAIKALREAETHTRAPTITQLMAEAHMKMGKLVEAQDLYQSIVALNINELKPPPGAPAWKWHPPQKAAQVTATQELLKLTPRIPLLMVSVVGAERSELKVTIDGEPFDLTQLDQEVVRDPGKHTIEAKAPGRKAVTKQVELQERAHEHVTLTLEPLPEVPPEHRQLPVGAIAGFAVGGAGLLVGVIAGSAYFVEANRAPDVCNQARRECPASYGNPLFVLGDVSGIGFGVALAGAAAGTALYFVSSKKAAAKPLGVALGPGFLTVKGSF